MTTFSVGTFTAQTADIAYVPRGMFFSELYLLTAQCVAAGVERVIESGVRNGLSTRVLRAFWPGALDSIERKPSLSPADLRADILKGDGRELVPRLIATHAPTPLGVLLDGPKGAKGDALRAVCWTFPHVKVVAQHDSAPGRGETMHTTDRDFRRAIGNDLDARIPAAVRAQYPLGCPGLGIWVRA